MAATTARCPQVYDNIKAINDKGYVYPRIINANYNQFFDDVAAHWSAKIPAFKGTIEDWWNFGAASTAYETGLNRMNHDKLAAAEFLATVASVAVPDRRYPYEALAAAYENLLLYDEHTWGSPTPGRGRTVALETQYRDRQRRAPPPRSSTIPWRRSTRGFPPPARRSSSITI